MKNRIKIYAIALLVIYIVIAVVGIARGLDEFKADVVNGYTSQRSGESYFENEVFDLDVKPKAGYYSFESKYRGIGGEEYDCQPSKISARLNMEAGEVAILLIVITVVMFILYFYLAFVLVYIPILFCFIIRDVLVKDIFDSSLISNIKMIGRLLVSVSVIYIVFEISRYFIARQLIQLSDYDILFPDIDVSPLILGVIALFISEVLKMSKKMKEEQELTI